MEKTTRQITEEMDYSGGINYNKMLPPEDNNWDTIWLKKEDVDKALKEIETLGFDGEDTDTIRENKSLSNRHFINCFKKKIQETEKTGGTNFTQNSAEFCPSGEHNSDLTETSDEVSQIPPKDDKLIFIKKDIFSLIKLAKEEKKSEELR